MDNIGGFSSVEYVLLDAVKSCAIIADRIIVVLADGKQWEKLPATPGKIEIAVPPTEESGLKLYPVTGTIYCPRYALAKYSDLKFSQQNKILLKYTTRNGDVLVAGDTENPVTLISENVNPSQANGYSGAKLTISGTMTHPELILFG